MKSKIQTILDEYGLAELVRIMGRYGNGYIIKIKDGDGDLFEYKGNPKLVRKALGYGGFILETDADAYYDALQGEYSYVVKQMKNERTTS